MKIILVIADGRGKNIIYILDNMLALTLEEIVEAVQKNQIPGAHVVFAKNGRYIRSNHNALLEDNLESISVSARNLGQRKKSKIPKNANVFIKEKIAFLRNKENQSKKVIYIDGEIKSTEENIIRYLLKYRRIIYSAAKDLKVDRVLLGAILIDEFLRRSWTDDWFDWLAILGRDTSVGLAQIKISTAKDLIRRGFYNPNPQDKNLSSRNIKKTPSRYLFKYLDNPKHSIYFAAAKINQIKKDFSRRFDIANQEIIGDLYSGTKPLSRSKATSRGKQISEEFYGIAKRALNL